MLALRRPPGLSPGEGGRPGPANLARLSRVPKPCAREEVSTVREGVAAPRALSPGSASSFPFTPPSHPPSGSSRAERAAPPAGVRRPAPARIPELPAPGARGRAKPLPRFSPRDRWCCRRRGRGPAGHPDDAQLGPSAALPFPRLPGGSRRQLRLRPAGSAGLEPRQPVHPRSEETDRAEPLPRPLEGGETDGRAGQCGGRKPVLRGGASPPARPRPSLQGPSSARCSSVQ